MTHMMRYAITASVNFLHKLQLSNYKAVSATDFYSAAHKFKLSMHPFSRAACDDYKHSFFQIPSGKFVKLQQSKLELLIVYV